MERGAEARALLLLLSYRGAALALWWFLAWMLFYEAMEPSWAETDGRMSV